MLSFRPCYVLALFGVLIMSSALKQHAQVTNHKETYHKDDPQQTKASSPPSPPAASAPCPSPPANGGAPPPCPTPPAGHNIYVPVSPSEIGENVNPVAKGTGDELTKIRADMVSKSQFEELEERVEKLESRGAEKDAHRLAPTVPSQEGASENRPFRQLTNGSTPTGWIQIGTPKKWLLVIFDTGSDKLVAKTWLTVAKELETVDQGVDGMVMPSDLIYNDLNSSSYHRKYVRGLNGEETAKITTITYGSGPATTNEGTENVLIGNRHLDNFTVMEITADSLQMLHTSKGVAGILGLQHMKNKSLGNSLFSRLRDDNLLSSFGYCHGTGNNGTFIWGDDSTEGQELDVFGQMHWALKLGDLKIPTNASSGSGGLIAKRGRTFRSPDSDGDAPDESDTAKTGLDGLDALEKEVQKELEDLEKEGKERDGLHEELVRADILSLANMCPDGKCTAILDTGSNIIAGPTEAIKAITNIVNVKPDCSNFEDLPDIQMTLGDMKVSVPATGYVMKVPMPADGGSADGDGDGQGGGGLMRGSETQQQDGHVNIVIRGDSSLTKSSDIEMSLAENRAAATNKRWKGVFERLHRNYGVDLREAVDNLLKQHNSSISEEWMCMPALVPLDAHTSNGPLWIVGTPLLDAYYARWSFGKNDASPKVHLKALQDADVCKEHHDADAHKRHQSMNIPVLMRSQKAGSDADVKPAARRHNRGPTPRLPEEIAYPHWAKNLLQV